MHADEKPFEARVRMEFAAQFHSAWYPYLSDDCLHLPVDIYLPSSSRHTRWPVSDRVFRQISFQSEDPPILPK